MSDDNVLETLKKHIDAYFEPWNSSGGSVVGRRDFPNRNSYVLKYAIDEMTEYSLDDDREIGSVSIERFNDFLRDEFNEALEDLAKKDPAVRKIVDTIP